MRRRLESAIVCGLVGMVAAGISAYIWPHGPFGLDDLIERAALGFVLGAVTGFIAVLPPQRIGKNSVRPYSDYPALVAERARHPERRGPFKDPENDVYVYLKMAGCLFGAIGVWVVIIGVPVAVYHGLTTGDWVWLLAVGVFTAVLTIGMKSGWIESLND
jgi:hypothetical protein